MKCVQTHVGRDGWTCAFDVRVNGAALRLNWIAAAQDSLPGLPG